MEGPVVALRIREVTSCAEHRQTTIVLEDPSGRLTLTFNADAGEAGRLIQEIRQGSRTCHPIYDFIGGLLGALEASPTRVVLEDLHGRGVGGLVYVNLAGAEIEVPCYPPDALALALRANLPVHARPEALDHTEPTAQSDEASGQVAKWIDRLKPTDF
jgi:uncharacterized protein